MRATRGRGEASPSLIANRKKCPDFGKKGPDCVHLWVKFSIQNVALGVFFCLRGLYVFLCFWRNVYRSALFPQNLQYSGL